MAVELLHGNTIANVAIQCHVPTLTYICILLISVGICDCIIIPLSACSVVDVVVNLLYCLMFFRILRNLVIHRTDLKLLLTGSG